MQIIKNIRNDVLKRNEIMAIVESENSPMFNEMKKQISEQAGKPEENINVHNIKGNFGSKEFKVEAQIYDTKEDLEKNKIKTKKQRDVEKKAKEEVAKPVEESVPVDTGAPTEDKSEQVEQEVKTEEKPSEAPAEDKPEEVNSMEDTSKKPLGVLDKEEQAEEETKEK